MHDVNIDYAMIVVNGSYDLLYNDHKMVTGYMVIILVVTEFDDL